jgi:hypothetical protein
VSGVRIESDGTPRGTFVYVNGEMLKGVQKVEWGITVHGRALARIEIWSPHLEVELPAGDVTIIGRRESRVSRFLERRRRARLQGPRRRRRRKR